MNAPDDSPETELCFRSALKAGNGGAFGDFARGMAAPLVLTVMYAGIEARTIWQKPAKAGVLRTLHDSISAR
jgi:hypothetical protein